MRNIFIIDEYISSQKNGIGTFLNEFVYCLSTKEYNLTLIIFNANTNEFNITNEDGITKFVFPSFNHGCYLDHSKITEKFFSLYIPDSSNNLFFLNHSPCNDFIKSLNKTHPLSKIIFTIHDFGWASLLMGNIKEYKRYVREDQYGKDEKKREIIVNIYNNESEIYHLVHRVVCLSKDSYKILRTIYNLDKNKISLVPNGIRDFAGARITKKEIAELKDSFNIKDCEKILVVIGRPTKPKGVFALVDSMKLVLNENKKVRLVIIGYANEQSLRELIEKASSVSSSISFTGLVDKSTLHKWLSIADIGIIPSFHEQFGFVGVEMMMHGLPIVASNGMGVRNMFEDNVNAIIAKIGNRKRPNEYIRNLANSILKLLNSPNLCEHLGSMGRIYYKEKYAINNMSINYKNLLDSL